MKRKDINLDHFLELYDSGMPVKQLAKRFKISVSAVYDRLRAAGGSPSRRAVIDPVALRTMADDGMSSKEIANTFGVSVKVVRARAAKIGINFTRRKDVDLVALRERYNVGASVKTLAREFGVAPSVIVDRLHGIGIVPRNRSEAMYVRMSQTTQEDRRRLTDAAHSAVRGVSHTDEHRCKIASARELNQSYACRTEDIFIEMLNERGIACTPQKAFGRYNVDIALDESPIVVEINGGGWHGFGAHASRYAERTKYLLNCGVDVVVIWINTTNNPLESGAADYIVALADKLGSQKPIRGKERMIRGNGESTSIGQRKFNNLPSISCSECRNNITGRFEVRPFDEAIEM